MTRARERVNGEDASRARKGVVVRASDTPHVEIRAFIRINFNNGQKDHLRWIDGKPGETWPQLQDRARRAANGAVGIASKGTVDRVLIRFEHRTVTPWKEVWAE